MLSPDRLASLDYAKPLQEPDELVALADLLRNKGVRSYLEIGVRYGGSFEAILTRLDRPRGVAIDFPGGSFGDKYSVPILLSTIKRLQRNGVDIPDYIFGPSSAPEVVARAKAHGPYDAVMIDGDHSYEAVKRDFELYAPLGRIVILHDIAAPDHVASRDGHKVEVPRFWNEIKDQYPHRVEICAPNTLMGIGVIFRDD